MFLAAKIAPVFMLITVRGSDDSIVFSIVAKFFLFFSLCHHDNSRTAARCCGYQRTVRSLE